MAEILDLLKARWRLISLLAAVLILAVVCVWMYADYLQPPPRGAYLGKTVVFRCTNCGLLTHYTLGEIRSMISRPEDLGSPIVVSCPQCGQKTLTQAVQCPNCGEIFIVIPGQSDLCPKCRTHYLQALREKRLRKTQS